VALSVGAEGLRADLVLCRAAAAFAGWEGRSVATSSDVERVGGLALGHRRRRRPFDPPTLAADELERALDAARRSFADAHPAPPPPEPEPAEAGADTAVPEPSNGEDDGADELSVGVAEGGDGAGAPEDGDGSAPAEDPDARTDTSPAAATEPPAHDPALAELEAEIEAEGGTGTPPPEVSDIPPAPDLTDGGGAAAGTAPTGSWQTFAGAAFDTGPAPLQLADPPAPTAAAPPAGAARGRVIGDQPVGEGSAGVALAATVRAAAQRRQVDPDGPVVTADDLRAPVRTRTVGRTVVIAVDASGSMGTHRRVEAATGAVLGLLADAYLRRDRVAMVTFRADGADVVLPPTASVELARSRLAELPTGGVTPLAEGITAGLSLARRAADDGWPPLLMLITDGRATGNQSARERALAAARDVAAAGVQVIVVDAEDGPNRLGLAVELAEAMDARHLRLDELTPASVETAVREALR
jgi:magnesium chelatase subunit D